MFKKEWFPEEKCIPEINNSRKRGYTAILNFLFPTALHRLRFLLEA